MVLLPTLYRASNRVGSLAGASRSSAFGSYFSSYLQHLDASSSSSSTQLVPHSFSGCPRGYRGIPDVNGSLGLPLLGNVGMRLICAKPKEDNSLPSSILFRNFEHSGRILRTEFPNAPPTEGSSRFGNFENSEYPKTEGPSRPMDFVRGMFEEQGRPRHGSQYSRYNVEQNPDTVHIKILKNNTFVTLTDSKGNKKPGSNVSMSAGALPDKVAAKNTRLVADASAEHVGRKAREIGIRSIVVKVNGYTLFKKKRSAIMSFKEGYNQSRGNQNPVVYIEDTTRRPHNGCRLKKQRRI